jgi:hypothetical protein
MRHSGDPVQHLLPPLYWGVCRINIISTRRNRSLARIERQSRQPQLGRNYVRKEHRENRGPNDENNAETTQICLFR